MSNSNCKGFRGFVLLLAIAATGFINIGCESLRGYPKQVVDEKAELKRLRHYFTDDVLQNYQDKAKMSQDEGRDYRDEVVAGRLRAIDLQFETFEKNINQEGNLTQIGTDWAILGLSGAGTIVGGATSKAILAAISGGLTGAKLSVDKTLYYQKTMPTLLAQMEASRADQLLMIRTGLQKQLISDYPLSMALVDLDRYYKDGTLPGAIIAINSAAGAKNEAAKAGIKKLVLEGSYTKDDASAYLQKKWIPGFPGSTAKDTAFESDLRKWMSKDSSLNDVEVSAFLLFPQYKDQRQKAMDYFKSNP